MDEHTSRNFLDVSLNLVTNIYEPYIKLNTNPKYVNFESNHPSCVKCVLINNIARRICKVPSNKANFDKHIGRYRLKLLRNVYKLEYTPQVLIINLKLHNYYQNRVLINLRITKT